MIIKDERNLVPTKFKDLNVGDVFKLKGQGETFMKIEEFYTNTNDDCEELFNCVSLDDGFIDCAYRDTEVFRLNAELRVWN